MQKKEIKAILDEVGNQLVSEMDPRGYWTGWLSSSALSTATALAALHFYDRKKYSGEIGRGLAWLAGNINHDGSYGDTPKSPGNVSTSLLVYAALNLQESAALNVQGSATLNVQKPGSQTLTALKKAVSGYLGSNGIDVSSPDVAKSILEYYKEDYTFSVPILTMCALCGIPGKDAFRYIPRLPFELLLLPSKFYRLLNLNVVSYALPALAGVGIVIHRNKRSGILKDAIRRFSIPAALKKLQKMQPESGGYLEAIPLTAFVSMSLACAGYKDSVVVTRGLGFLKSMQRNDGSWPIDVDLSTWVTSLSVRAFRSRTGDFLSPPVKTGIARYFKSIQNKTIHRFNGTGPGGWGWTNFPGAVPDGDDTPGVIISLLALEPKEKVKNEVLAGCEWLLSLQNGDGGFPTFSRGWGKLPFDRSCADLTAHGLLAMSAIIGSYGNELPATRTGMLRKCFYRALGYLEKNQYEEGYWLPLWFGNQWADNQANPVYGTAKVLTYLKDALRHGWQGQETVSRAQLLTGRGEEYLASMQNDDGSWGGAGSLPGTIEETSLAVSALAGSGFGDRCGGGLAWIESVRSGRGLPSAPIGLYFASLWYDEKLYPVTFYLEALARMLETEE